MSRSAWERSSATLTDPLLLSVQIRRGGVHARHDGHRPQPRPERRRVEGLARKPATNVRLGRYRRFLEMYGTWLGIEHRAFEQRSSRQEGERLSRRTPNSPRSISRQLVASTRPCRDGRASISRRTARADAPGGRRGVRSWNSDRAKKYMPINEHRGLTGTAVNVQAMVFGNMGETSGTGVCFHAQSLHRRERFLRRVPDQRAGRGRRRGHPHPGGHRAHEAALPRRTNELRQESTELEKHYTRHAGHRVHRARRASSTCSRRARASAPARPP